MNEANASPKVLQRSRRERMVAGVAGGLAQYFNVDPVLVRLVFVILTLWSGVGLLLYIIFAIVMPERPVGETEPAITAAPISLSGNRGRELLAYALVGLGVLILAGNFGLFRLIDWRYVWPLLLIGLGALLLTRRERS